MADKRLTVVMGSRIAGALTRGANNLLRFEYDTAYRTDPAATPLSLSMPIAIGSHADTAASRRVTNFLWGLLPDNDAVIERWCAHYAVRATSPFFLLGTPVGEDCAGAVRFCPSGDEERLLGRGGDVEWLTDDAIAERLRSLRDDQASWLGPRFTGEFSLAGAQPKTALVNVNGRWGEPRGDIPTTHIFKPGSILLDHDLVEHLCLTAARRAGLPTARSSFGLFGDQTALVVERYDRARTPDGVVRIHQEDLCQALGLSPERKYQNVGGPSPAQAVELMRRHIDPRAAETAVATFVDALAWNWIIAGTDAHAKNYSFLLAGANARLAPFYDVASFLPYAANERELRMSMRLGSTYDMWPSHNFWPKAAAELDLDPERVVARVRALTDEAPTAFAEAAGDPVLRSLGRPIVGLLVDRVTDRAKRCRSVVD
jgi:serine/threonine-protein kinase HipA